VRQGPKVLIKDMLQDWHDEKPYMVLEGSQSGSESKSNAQSIRSLRIHQLSKVLTFVGNPGGVATWIKISLADERYGKSRFGSVALDVGRTVASLSEQPCGKLPHTVRSAPLAANTWKAQSPSSIA